MKCWRSDPGEFHTHTLHVMHKVAGEGESDPMFPSCSPLNLPFCREAGRESLAMDLQNMNQFLLRLPRARQDLPLMLIISCTAESQGPATQTKTTW